MSIQKMLILLLCVLTVATVCLGQEEEASGDAPAADNEEVQPDENALEEIEDDVTADEADPAPALPREVHCGTLKAIERSLDPVDWIDLDKVLLQGQFEPEATVDESTITQRSPADGMAYVIVTASLKDQRSVSRFDYILRSAGQTFPCLAMSVAGRPFDQRQWKYDLPGEVRLLFECPLEARTVTLDFALDTAIPQPALAALAIIEPEPHAEPAPDESDTEDETPEQTTREPTEAASEPDKGDTKAKEPAKPEPEPKGKAAEPKPKPKPAEKKESKADDDVLF